MGPDLKRRSGTILIVTLWILVILTVFALALGQQVSLEVKLAQYQRDKLRATELAKAAIERAILELKKKEDPVKDVDALSESWANNKAAFKDIELGDGAFTGTFTVSYLLDGAALYGMEDEEGKININEVEEQVLVDLLEYCGVEDADRLASSILIWCGRKGDLLDEEETYYQGLDLPYHCKKEPFKSVAELLLVRHMTAEILYGEDIDGDGKFSEDEQGIAQYLTVYGDGKVNINTASEEVLRALIDQGYPNLVDKILDYRKGDDEIGDDNDGWFRDNSSTVDSSANYGDIRNLDEPASDPFEKAEWTHLRANGLLSVSSNTYTIHAQAEVEKVSRSIDATIDLTQAGQISYLSWYRN